MVTGPELIDEIGKEPTLDRVMQRDNRSKPATDEELMGLILRLRADRAQFVLKDEKKAAKRQGIEEPEDAGDDAE